mmetsp:Transcript_14784/g.46537  ORF Transcript_14784/g.46537 Transcript_14784/m.46537 type:complete len:315 (-) Transcript_14784:54-998(-)
MYKAVAIRRGGRSEPGTMMIRLSNRRQQESKQMRPTYRCVASSILAAISLRACQQNPKQCSSPCVGASAYMSNHLWQRLQRAFPGSRFEATKLNNALPSTLLFVFRVSDPLFTRSISGKRFPLVATTTCIPLDVLTSKPYSLFANSRTSLWMSAILAWMPAATMASSSCVPSGVGAAHCDASGRPALGPCPSPAAPAGPSRGDRGTPRPSSAITLASLLGMWSPSAYLGRPSSDSASIARLTFRSLTCRRAASARTSKIVASPESKLRTEPEAQNLRPEARGHLEKLQGGALRASNAPADMAIMASWPATRRSK